MRATLYQARAWPRIYIKLTCPLVFDQYIIKDEMDSYSRFYHKL